MGVEIPAPQRRSFHSSLVTVAQSGMPSREIVAAFDELEASDAGLSLCLELPTIQQFAFERREEAFAHGIVVTIAYRSNRRAHTHFLAAQAKRHRCV